MMTLPTDALLAATLRAIGDGVISCDREGRVVLMNAVAEQLTGWTERDAVGHLLKQVFVIVNEATRETVEDPVDKVLRLGRVVGLANHTILVRQDGSEVAIDDSAAPVHDGAGTLVGVVLVFRDVTERRQAELNLALLAESGTILGEARDTVSITHRIGVAISRHFADFCIFDLTTVHEKLERTVGQHRDPSKQAIANGLVAFTPGPEDSKHLVRRAMQTNESLLLNNILDEQLQGAAMNESHLTYFREQLHPRSIIVVPMESAGEKLGAVSFYRDSLAASFTEADFQTAKELVSRICLALHYSRVRESLAVERAQLEAILTAAPVGIIVANTSGRIVRANSESEHILGHGAHYSASASDYEEYVAFHPDGRQVRGEEYPLARALGENRTIRDEHYLYQRGDGSRRWVSFSATPVLSPDGRNAGAVVSISDIDELTRAQQRAERSEERIQRLMDRASVGIGIGDVEGGLKYANDTLLRWIGYTREDIAAGHVRWDKLTPAQYAAKDAAALRQLQETGYAAPYEKAYTAKDGHLVPMLVGATMVPSLDADGASEDVAVFYTNLSLQKQAEAALLQTEKLTAVGRLASSISHEINNPLEAVTNLLFIVRNDPTLSQGGKDYLTAADRELARVSQVTSQTLRFHRQTTAATLVQPRTLLEEVLSIYSSRLENASIAISREYGPEVSVTCYEGDIRQVLNNFVSNAFAAMQGGGHLRLRTRYITWWQTGQKGVRITVADTGTGIQSDVRSRIFDAFFTTKGIHGTGLGLWISRRIVHKHRGHIRIKSSVKQGGHGSVFTLWLPLELAETAREAWYADDDQSSGASTVLAGQNP